MSKITVMCMHSTHRFSISDNLEESVSSGEEEGGGGQNRSSNKARRDAFRRVASHAPRGPHAFEQARATRLASILVNFCLRYSSRRVLELNDSCRHGHISLYPVLNPSLRSSSMAHRLDSLQDHDRPPCRCSRPSQYRVMKHQENAPAVRYIAQYDEEVLIAVYIAEEDVHTCSRSSYPE